MTAPVNNMSLEDLSFFMDERLFHKNVYNIILYCYDIDIVIPDLLQIMHKYSSVQMIQEVGNCYSRLTFVSSLNFISFGFWLNKVISSLRIRHNFDDKSLYYV